SITVGEYIKEHISKFGENIRVRRFVRFKVGEQL
ncbi:elongation factor Ts, partial [archaeon]